MLLKDRVGIVTGAASGMGRDAAALFAAEGARVLCADLDAAGAAKIAREIADRGGSAASCEVDVANQASAHHTVTSALDRFGRVDFLANYAGVWDGAAIGEIDDARWDRVLNVNLKGSFFMCQAVAPGMVERRYGRIILVGSVAARLGGEMGGPHYAASKGGIISLGRALARRLGKHNITVNTINPGATETPMTASWPAEVKAAMAKATPGGRLGRPDDIAHVALLLLSDHAAWINGQTIEANGGYYFG